MIAMGDAGEAVLTLSLQRVTLSSNQRSLADAIAAALDLHALRPQFAALELLRSAVEPWLTEEVRSKAEREAVEASEDPCPICLSVIHAKSFQRPRLRCATCRHGMHATCIYRWLQQHAAQRGGFADEAGSEPEAKCPLCQSAL